METFPAKQVQIAFSCYIAFDIKMIRKSNSVLSKQKVFSRVTYTEVSKDK